MIFTYRNWKSFRRGMKRAIYFIEFSGRNELSGENSKRKLSTSNVLLVPHLTNFITSSTEFYATSICQTSQNQCDITLRSFAFFFQPDRLVNHRGATFLPTTNGIFNVNQFKVQLFIQTKTRLHILEIEQWRMTHVGKGKA